jgi:hypothetical protein
MLFKYFLKIKQLIFLIILVYIQYNMKQLKDYPIQLENIFNFFEIKKLMYKFLHQLNLIFNNIEILNHLFINYILKK